MNITYKVWMLVFLVLVSASAVTAATNLNACGVLVENTTYNLTTNLLSTTTECLATQGNNIKLEGNNFNVTQMVGGGYALHVYGTFLNVTVYNLNLKATNNNGLAIDEVYNIDMQNITISINSSGHTALYLVGNVMNATLKNFNIKNNQWYGIFTDQPAHDVKFENFYVQTDNYSAIFVNSGSKINFTNTVINVTNSSADNFAIARIGGLTTGNYTLNNVTAYPLTGWVPFSVVPQSSPTVIINTIDMDYNQSSWYVHNNASAGQAVQIFKKFSTKLYLYNSTINGPSPSYIQITDNNLTSWYFEKNATTYPIYPTLTEINFIHNYANTVAGTNWTEYNRNDYTAFFSQMINLTPFSKNITVTRNAVFNISVLGAYGKVIPYNVTIMPNIFNNQTAFNCTFTPNYTETIIANIHANFTWFQNGVENHTFDSYRTFFNESAVSATKLVYPLTVGDNWTCSVQTLYFTNYSDFVNSSDLSISDANIKLYVYHEDHPAILIPATIEGEIIAWESTMPGSKSYYYFNFSSPLNNHTLDLFDFDPSSTYLADIYIQSTPTGGPTNRFYLINYTLTAGSQNLSLYGLNYTSGLSTLELTLRDKNTFWFLSNIITSLQRRYVGEGVWRTVQMDETDDFGKAIFNIREKDTDYRLVMLDRATNRILYTTESMKFSCTSSLCSLATTLDRSVSTAATNLTVAVDYNNVTKIITINWADSTGLTRQVRTLVTKLRGDGIITICDQNQTGNSGTSTCDVSAYTGDIRVRVLQTASPEESIYDTIIRLASTSLRNLVGQKEGAFWAFGIGLTTATLGLFSPVISIFAMLAGMVFLAFLGLTNIFTFGFIGVCTVIAILISIKVRT